MKMNQEIKEEWLKDLLSGEFKQGTGRLHTVNEDGSEEFCCLGLLSRIAVKHGVIPPPIKDENDADVTFYRYGAENQRFYLPDEVAKWAEIHPSGKYVIDDKDWQYRVGNLSTDNDNGTSFEEIAEIIKERL